MSGKNVSLIIDQVKGRLMEAQAHFYMNEYDAADKVLVELCDLLVNVYDRPDKKLIEPDPAADQ